MKWTPVEAEKSNKKRKKPRKSQKRRKRTRKRDPRDSQSEDDQLNLEYDGEEKTIPVDYNNKDENRSESSSPAYSPTSPIYSRTGSDTDSRGSYTSPSDPNTASRSRSTRHRRSRHSVQHTDPSPQETNSGESDSEQDLSPGRPSDKDSSDEPQVSCNDPTHHVRRTNTIITPAEVAANKPKALESIRTDKPIRRGAFYYELFTDVLDLPKGL